MVKSGQDRAEKFAMKYDAYANMLRAKRLDKASIKQFQEKLLFAVNLDNWLQGLDLPYGKLGAFSDLAKKYAYKGTDILEDLERFEIDTGYFEALVEFVSTALTLYERCVFPQSNVRSQITLDPVSFETLFPETVEKRLLETLPLDLDPVNPTSCFIVKAKVCCHKVVRTLSPLLTPVLAGASILNISPLFAISIDSNEVENLSPILETAIAFDVSGGLEGFYDFIEVDPNSHITIDSETKVTFIGYRNETAYLYKDEGIDYFGDFTHYFDSKISPAASGIALGYNYVLSNDLGDVNTLRLANKTLISIQPTTSTSNLNLYLDECYNGTKYDSSALALSLNTTYYFKVVKAGANFTVYVYSDSARTVLVGSRSLTLHGNWKFRYIMPCNTYNDGTNTHQTNEVENLVY